MPPHFRGSSSGFSAGQFDGAAVADDYPNDTCTEMVNFRIGPAAEAQVRNGSVYLSSLTSADAGWAAETQPTLEEFEATGVGPQLIAAGGDTGLIARSLDGGATWAHVASVGAGGGRFSTATVRVGATNYVCMVNGAVAKKWNGASLSDIANFPAGGNLLAFANNRLWTASVNRVYGSKIENVDVWAAPDGLSVPVGGSESITALREGPDGRLLVFKRSSTSIVDGYGQSTLIVSTGARGASSSEGCIDAGSICPGAGGLFFRGERGLMFYDGERVHDVGAGARRAVQDYATSDTRCWAFLHPDTGEAWIAGMMAGTAHNALVLDTRRPVGNPDFAVWKASWAADSVRPLGACIASCTVDGITKRRPVCMTDGGDVLALDVSGRTEDGEDHPTSAPVPIAATLQTKKHDFGHPGARKRAREMTLMMSNGGAATAAISCYVVGDGTAGASQSRSVPPDQNPRPFRFRVGTARGAAVNLWCVVNAPGGVAVTGAVLGATGHQGGYRW